MMTTFGYLQLDGWGGRTQQRVEVVGRTQQRTRIRAITLTRLTGHRRWLQPGETALVPHHAVRLEAAGGEVALVS